MSPSSNQAPQTDYLRALRSTARQRPGLWFVPLFSSLLIAVLVAFVGPKNWDATQSFVVREELIGRIVGPGRFDSLDSMKTAQEVILETARRPGVLQRVYESVGQANPSRDDIESLRDAISFEAPGGGELGKTEILTMRVKSNSVERAKQLVDALFEETRLEVRDLRQREANSMLQEIGGSVALARERLTETTDNIRQLEASVGGDLTELRGLNEPYSGGSDLRRQITGIQSEIRQARQAEEEATQLIAYLQAAAQDPMQLLATPRELMNSQPSLLELKKQLITAQVNRSNVGGIYSAKHPRYVATANSVVDIRTQIELELESSLVGLRSQQELAQQQVAMLNKKSAEIEDRVSKLAALRVDYGQLVNEMQLRNEELTTAHKEFAQAEAMLRAAEQVDFMTRLDEAQAGYRPLGPSKKTLILGAALAGSLIGLGLIMMVTPSPTWFPPQSPSPPDHDPRGPGPLPSGPPAQSASLPQSPPTQLPATGVPGFMIPDMGPSPVPHQPLG